MGFDQKADEMKKHVSAIYKESTELVKFVLMITRDFKTEGIGPRKLSQLFKEIKDVFENTDGGYQLLEDLAYTESGETAIVNILYYILPVIDLL